MVLYQVFGERAVSAAVLEYVPHESLSPVAHCVGGSVKRGDLLYSASV